MSPEEAGTSQRTSNEEGSHFLGLFRNPNPAVAVAATDLRHTDIDMNSDSVITSEICRQLSRGSVTLTSLTFGGFKWKDNCLEEIRQPALLWRN